VITDLTGIRTVAAVSVFLFSDRGNTRISVRTNLRVALSDLVVACLPLNPSFAGSNPADDDGILRAIKIHSRTSFGVEVKSLAPCRKSLLHVNEPHEY
jgi:hypothetical protein